MIITRVLSRLCRKLLIVVSLVTMLGEMCCTLHDDQFEQGGSNPWFEHVVEGKLLSQSQTRYHYC